MKTLAALLSSVCLWFGSTAFAVDTEAPELVSISTAPDPVDISTATQQLSVTLQVTDDEAGLSFGAVYLYNPDNRFVRSGSFSATERTSGSATDGTYVCSVAVPAHAIPGTWRLEVYLLDTEGHGHTYNPNSGPDDVPFPVVADSLVTVINTGTIDGEEPQLGTFMVAPDPVATGPAPAPLTLTMQITDGLAGFRYGFVYVYDPEGNYQENLSPYFDQTLRVSGDDLDGSYELPLTLPQGSVSGIWNLHVYFVDDAGNGDSHFAGSFVVDDAGTPSPALGKAVEASQYLWTTSTPRWTSQTTETHDGIDAAMSGPTEDNGQTSFQTTVTGPGTLSFWWKVDSEADHDILSARVEGTPEIREISGQTSWAEETLPIPAGEWTVVFRYEKDGGNAVNEDRGWVDQVRFTGENDMELPVLQSLTISPDPVDISGGPQTATFTLEVSDDFFGVLGGEVVLIDPEGDSDLTLPFDGLNRTSGDNRYGIYEVSREFPADAVPGTWLVEVILQEEVSLNTRTYGSADDDFLNPGEQFFVVTDGSAGDTEAPLVVSIEVTPDTVDITGGAGAVTVAVRIIDHGSGFRDGSVNAYTANGNWTGSTYLSSSSRIAGTAMDGIYQLTVPVAAHGPAGSWRIGLDLYDQDDNRREYPYDPPFEVPGDEYFQVENSGPEDTELPVVTSIAITPGTVDTSAAPASITVTVSLEDDLSGIKEAFVFFYNPSGDYFPGMFGAFDLPNSPTSGEFEVTVTVPQGATPGQWSARVFLRDRVGWTKFYDHGGTPYPEPGDGLFTVGGVPASVFDAFTSLHGLTGPDALRSADPDHDGSNNATELLLGTDPDDGAEAGVMTLTKDATHVHLTFIIDPALAVATSGSFLELGGGTSPFRVTGQTQAGLSGTWTNVLPTLVGGSTYRISLALGVGSKGFMRLLFEEP